MEQLEVQYVVNNNQSKYKKLIWTVIMTCLLGSAAIIGFICTWGRYLSYINYVVAAAVLGILFSVLIGYLSKKYSKWIKAALIIPCIPALFPAGIAGIAKGAGIWINVLIYNWNAVHENSIALFNIKGGDRDIFAFSLLMAVVIGELAFELIYIESNMKCQAFIIFWLTVQLLGANTSQLSCCMLIAIGIIKAVAGKGTYISKRSIVFDCVLFTMLMTGIVFQSKEMSSVASLREDIKNEIHDMRYGENYLPEGDLSMADTLLQNQSEMLKVYSEQEKNIYLKGYVGGKYDEKKAKWLPLSETAYGEENYGMLRWLSKKGFSPLKQPAEYYELCGNGAVERNRVVVNIIAASRDCAYVPSTVEKFQRGNAGQSKDTIYKGKGIWGISEYEITEFSDVKPSELVVADSWLENPETLPQKEYVEAESVYRNFVYENYTVQTEKYNKLVNELFWNDYKESDGESIYSSVEQVRNVLKSHFTYNKQPAKAPKDEDPLYWYITVNPEGNSMIYSSVAVEALRAKGIPARYVEGYYVLASRLSKSQTGEVSITGEDAHAWVEVYFDGIGWLPVDVTPGYYYEAAALKNMINTPTDVHKTASFDDEKKSGVGNVVDDVENSGLAEKIINKIGNTGLLILGILALIFVALSIILVTIGITYFCALTHQRRVYARSSSYNKVRILEKRIYQLLEIKGIDASLGWNTKEVDDIITEKFDNVMSGDYSRVCVLLEKAIYGNLELEPYEIRTLEILADILFNDHTGENRYIRLKKIHLVYKHI